MCRRRRGEAARRCSHAPGALGRVLRRLGDGGRAPALQHPSLQPWTSPRRREDGVRGGRGAKRATRVGTAAKFRRASFSTQSTAEGWTESGAHNSFGQQDGFSSGPRGERTSGDQDSGVAGGGHGIDGQRALQAVLAAAIRQSVSWQTGATASSFHAPAISRRSVEQLADSAHAGRRFPGRRRQAPHAAHAALVLSNSRRRPCRDPPVDQGDALLSHLT